MSSGMSRAIKRFVGLTAIAWLGLSPASAAGTSKHEVVPNNGDELTYGEDGKLIFYLGCGRGFALHAKYPGQARKEGEANLSRLSPLRRQGVWKKVECDQIASAQHAGFARTHHGIGGEEQLSAPADRCRGLAQGARGPQELGAVSQGAASN
jgi:hypothetical protein